MRIVLKSLLTGIVLAFVISALDILYRVFVVGQYWDAAPLFLSFLVGFAAPIVLILGSVFVLFSVWKNKHDS